MKQRIHDGDEHNQTLTPTKDQSELGQNDRPMVGMLIHLDQSNALYDIQ